MLSKNKISYLRSLQDKKTRHEMGRFIVEGKKSILETISSDFEILEGFFANDFLNPLQKNFPMELITEAELKKISTLATNHDGIIVVKMKNSLAPISENFFQNNFSIVLDSINDPGNLGTIVRIADWYGVKNIIASRDSVDFYNPKTIMATMGSFTRVNVHYENLENFFTKNPNIPVYGTFLDGENIRTLGKIPAGCIIIGNEARGISKNVEQFVTKKITIPRFGNAESLNAGVATGIILERLIGR